MTRRPITARAARRVVVTLGVALGSAWASTASAETLAGAMASAWERNAGIRSAAAQLSAVAESIPQAEAERWPSLTASFGVGRKVDQERSFVYFGLPPADSISNYVTRLWSVNAEYSLYRGGATEAGVDKARAGTAAQRAALADSLQALMLNVAIAYADVILAQDNVRAAKEALEGLLTQQQAVDRAFRRQDATRTDVDQTIERVEAGRAELAQAEGQLANASIAFRRWVGQTPGELAPLPPTTDLPPSRAEAIREAVEVNPLIRRAQYEVEAARADITIARSQTLPKLRLVAGLSNEFDFLGASSGTKRKYSIGLQFVMPLYQGGAPAARLGASRDVERQRQAQLEQARNLVAQDVATAWDSRGVAIAELKARDTQVRANSVALEGLRREQGLGLRTVLDVLNGRRDLVTAKLAANQAQHDLALAELRVLAALGRLTPARFGLPGAPVIEPVWDGTGGWSSVLARVLSR